MESPCQPLTKRSLRDTRRAGVGLTTMKWREKKTKYLDLSPRAATYPPDADMTFSTASIAPQIII